MAEKSDSFESGLEGASQAVATFNVDDKSLLTRFQGALHKTPSLVPLIVLVCAIAIFTGWLGPRFLPQMTLVFQQIQVVGILALAQTLVILNGKPSALLNHPVALLLLAGAIIVAVLIRRRARH